MENVHEEKKKRLRLHSENNYCNVKRNRTGSSSNSDSGFSSMSSNSKLEENNGWPSLVLLTKPDEPVINGRNRKRFPDALRDRSILLACYDGSKKMLPKLRQYRRPGSIHTYPNIFKVRDIPGQVDDSKNATTDEDDESILYISLDSISLHDKYILNDIEENKNIMLSDIRDHKVAIEYLPDGVSGYWVRIFGMQKKYTLLISLWKDISNIKSRRYFCSDGNNKLMKIGELSVELVNTGPDQMAKRLKRKRRSRGIPQMRFFENTMQGMEYTPSFCSKEKYMQIITCLHESFENGNYKLFKEMLDKFTMDLDIGNNNDKELKLFLDCERSQMYAIQGQFFEGKKILQKVVENVISKSSNKIFLLNRAYMMLSYIHLVEGNYGTSEECLTIIHVDQKNGMSFEDVGFFYFLYGTVTMKFGKKLPHLSNNLWVESENYLRKSINNFQKVPSLLNALCRSHLNLAQLNIYKSVKSGNSCFDASKYELGVIENFGVHRLSEHTKCLLKIVQINLLFHNNESQNAWALLDEVEKVALNFGFHEEKLLIKTIKEWRHNGQNEELVEAAATNPLVDMTTPSDDYYADDSS